MVFPTLTKHARVQQPSAVSSFPRFGPCGSSGCAARVPGGGTSLQRGGLIPHPQPNAQPCTVPTLRVGVHAPPRRYVRADATYADAHTTYGAPFAKRRCETCTAGVSAPLPPYSGVRSTPLQPRCKSRAEVLTSAARRADAMQPYLATRTLHM